jgi:hypothetical protein
MDIKINGRIEKFVFKIPINGLLIVNIPLKCLLEKKIVDLIIKKAKSITFDDFSFIGEINIDNQIVPIRTGKFVEKT